MNETLMRAFGPPPEPDFRRWCAEHPNAVAALGAGRAHRRWVIPAVSGGAAAATAMVLAVLMLAQPAPETHRPAPTAVAPIEEIGDLPQMSMSLYGTGEVALHPTPTALEPISAPVAHGPSVTSVDLTMPSVSLVRLQ
ncbi:MAG: hypothetical protein ACP5HU_08970 [Phycisphaerae bacterium]